MKASNIFLAFSIACVVVAIIIYIRIISKGVNEAKILVTLNFDTQTMYFFAVLAPFLIFDSVVSLVHKISTLSLIYSISFIIFALLAAYIGFRKKAITPRGIAYTALDGRILEIIEWKDVLEWHWSYDNKAISMIVSKKKRKLNIRWTIPEDKHDVVDRLMRKYSHKR